LGRGQSAPDQLLGMSTDGRDAAQVDHRAVPAAQPELRAEVGLRGTSAPAPGLAYSVAGRASPVRRKLMRSARHWLDPTPLTA
jgi:hypothetical protein